MLKVMIAGAALALLAEPAAAECRVGTAVIAAMDISGSVSEAEFALERDATAAAIESPEVVRAIQSNAEGRIEIAVLQWAGEAWPTVSWQIITDQRSASLAAAALRSTQRMGSGMTALGTALVTAAGLFAQAPCAADHLVLDVSGDGRVNAGLPMGQGRAALEALGVTVNGLAMVGDEPDIGEWYKKNVRSPDGFVLVVESPAEFGRAMLTKLTAEVS